MAGLNVATGRRQQVRLDKGIGGYILVVRRRWRHWLSPGRLTHDGSIVAEFPRLAALDPGESSPEAAKAG
jgi:hypothetical protein